MESALHTLPDLLGSGMDHQIAKHAFDPDLFEASIHRSSPRHRLHQQEGRQHLAPRVIDTR